jgi:hypothetical protein
MGRYSHMVPFGPTPVPDGNCRCDRCGNAQGMVASWPGWSFWSGYSVKLWCPRCMSTRYLPPGVMPF